MAAHGVWIHGHGHGNSHCHGHGQGVLVLTTKKKDVYFMLLGGVAALLTGCTEPAKAVTVTEACLGFMYVRTYVHVCKYVTALRHVTERGIFRNTQNMERHEFLPCGGRTASCVHHEAQLSYKRVTVAVTVTSMLFAKNKLCSFSTLIVI
jgi:hypothetical protein